MGQTISEGKNYMTVAVGEQTTLAALGGVTDGNSLHFPETDYQISSGDNLFALLSISKKINQALSEQKIDRGFISGIFGKFTDHKLIEAYVITPEDMDMAEPLNASVLRVL